jgi:hypothetical protein
MAILSVALLLLGACDNDDDADEDSGGSPEPAAQRGDLVDGDPSLSASYTPDQLVALLSTNEIAQELADEVLTPECTIDVHQLRYLTIAPDGSLMEASGALMVPNDAGESCTGARPVLLYAHGTATDSSFNIADLEGEDNGEGVLLATVFAAKGYIVVAPNYAGYDSSTLDFHPYLNGEQQSADMVDALTAARASLPTANAAGTTDGGELFVTGYSQGGYVAMATQRALEDAGIAVTASAPMSGPYALSAFGDAIFQGQVTGGAPVNLTLLLTSYQRSYGDIYTEPADAFAEPYAAEAEGLLPSTTPVSELRAAGLLPENALFDSVPPAPEFTAFTPATTPTELAPVFALGFGPEHLLTNEFRLAYLRDSIANPDGGFPTLTDGLPPAAPENPLRIALKLNDQRNWTPIAPTLLCAGHDDPTVLYLNTALMQQYWSGLANVTVLDIDSDVGTDDPFAAQKTEFAVAEELVRLSGGDEAVLERYHTALVAPFRLSAAKSFFDER